MHAGEGVWEKIRRSVVMESHPTLRIISPYLSHQYEMVTSRRGFFFIVKSRIDGRSIKPKDSLVCTGQITGVVPKSEGSKRSPIMFGNMSYGVPQQDGSIKTRNRCWPIRPTEFKEKFTALYLEEAMKAFGNKEQMSVSALEVIINGMVICEEQVARVEDFVPEDQKKFFLVNKISVKVA